MGAVLSVETRRTSASINEGKNMLSAYIVFVMDCANDTTLSAKISLTNLNAVCPSIAECSKLIPALPSDMNRGWL